jgi:hypothetical protein
MEPATMDALLSEMTPGELKYADRCIEFLERAGMPADEADELRRRILAWQRFTLDMGRSSPDS